jgi:hypothetical protein
MKIEIQNWDYLRMQCRKSIGEQLNECDRQLFKQLYKSLQGILRGDFWHRNWTILKEKFAR